MGPVVLRTSSLSTWRRREYVRQNLAWLSGSESAQPNMQLFISGERKARAPE